MARLRLPDGTEHELDPRVATTVGSGGEATLRLAKAGVADLHCVVRALKDGGFGVKDLGSGTPTEVNGRVVQAARLLSGDELRLGQARLTYEDESEPAAEPGPAASATPASAPAASAAADLVAGTRIGGYEIVSVLGHGGMGTVYRATQLSLHREVALKVLKAELCEDPAFVKRFLSEARAAGRFNHPHVVQVFDADEADGRPFFSMELLPAGSLEERLTRSGRLPVDAAIGAILHAAQGLAYAESLGVVHRDIKPDNLMTTAQGAVKICDLGLATDPSLLAGKIAGTPHFLSPEQARGQPADHRSDLYSLGCTFYRLLTGKNPFPRKTVREILKAHLEAPPPKLRDELPEVPEAIETIVGKLMAKDPAQRYQHARELVADLEALQSGQAKSRLPLVLAAVAVVAVGVAAWLVLGRDDTPITIVKTDPEAERIREQNRQMAADNALLRIAKDLPPLDRAARLEAMAKEHDGTRAAARAASEAKTLREAEAARLAAARERETREREIAQRIQALAEPLTAAPVALERLVTGWDSALKTAGAGERPPVVEAALATLAGAIEQAAQRHAQATVTSLDAQLAAGTPDLQRLGADLKKALTAPGALPDAALKALDDGLTRGREILAARSRALDEARREQLRSLLVARRALLLAPDGVLALLRRGQVDEALARLRAQAVVPGLESAHQPILRLEQLLGQAKTGLGQLGPSIAGKPIAVTWLGEDLTVTKLEAGRATLAAAGGRGERTIEVWDSPAFAAELLGKTNEPGAKCALLAIALTHGLPAAARFLDAAAKGTASDLEFPWPVVEPLQAISALPEDWHGDARAVVALGRLMRAWQAGADEAAQAAMQVLERELKDTLVGVALAIETEPPPAPGNPDK